eukprot:7141571-Alexandrium_andersonii.AAC.1
MPILVALPGHPGKPAEHALRIWMAIRLGLEAQVLEVQEVDRVATDDRSRERLACRRGLQELEAA